MQLRQWSMQTPQGELYLVASERGLQATSWEPMKVEMATSLNEPGAAIAHLRQAQSQLQQYFAGKRRDFDIPLDLQGTTFQKRVWQQLCKIPFGKTCSYRDVAVRIRSPQAMRAVGGANGKNPVCIIVPCHRVIAADGSLGGYSAGLARKRRLLALEGVTIAA
jgi:methylated-DNA-[protein]-cysteine S-methyltransferase